MVVYSPPDMLRTDGGEPRIQREAIPDDPMVAVDVNVSLAEDPSQLYEAVDVSRMFMRITRSRVIDPRYTLDEAVSLISEFFEAYPVEVSLVEQSALWLRFFAGFHLFQDANHRTGFNTLQVAMMNSGIQLESGVDGEQLERTRVAREKSREVRDVEKISNRRNLFEKDSLYHVWRDYFDDVLSP